MKTLVIDGHNAAWRIANRLPILTTGGRQIQVVYGMMNLVHGVMNQFWPDVAIVCWDTGHSAYRKKIFPGYKAGRHQHKNKQEERQYGEVCKQIEECKRILRKLNMSQLYYPDDATEADDLIAMVCQSEDLNGLRIIVSSDNDMLQLVDDRTEVWSPHKTDLFTKHNIRQKTGLDPNQWLQLLAACGGHDGIPGIAHGLGEGTLRPLLAQFGSMKQLFESEKKVSKLGFRQKLLYGEGVREAYYRNLLLTDLSIAVVQHPEEKKVRQTVLEAIQRRDKISRKEITDYFLEKKFQSLLKDFAKWITPFENLDTK